LEASRFGSAITFDRAGGVSSHQLSLSSRRGSRDRRNRMGMIFAMAGRCPADWQRICPPRSGFADFHADFAQTAAVAPHGLFGGQAAMPRLHRSRTNLSG